MRYLLLIYSNEATDAQMSQETMASEYEAYNAFTAEIQQKGVLNSGEALMPTNTATTVRVQSGKVLTTDGPFAETKEQLGGYYLLDCKDIDEAIAFATKIPAVAHGSIEIRPVMVFS